MRYSLTGRLLAAAMALTVSACTGIQVNVADAGKAGPAARVLGTRLEFVDRGYRAIPDAIVEQKSDQRDLFRHVPFPDPIEVSFYSLSGRPAGREVDRFYRLRLKRAHAWIEAGTQQEFALSLAAIEEAIRGRATRYRPQPEDRDFKVEPDDTALARLILSAGDPFLFPYNEHEAGFIERQTRDLFALLYVDRPCRITGAIQANDGLYRHDLAFNAAGLYWIRLQPAGDGSGLVTRNDPAGAVAVYSRSFQ